jgi:L-ascorbate metabolism protein UlaG (beta-lactamase superfamily)
MDVAITKLVHSCLLVDVGGTRTLLDPGTFTWDDERFDASMVEGVDRILITHEHADHFSIDFVKAALERSNDAVVETTASLQSILHEHGIGASTDGTPQFGAPHERIPTGPGPQNTGFHVGGVLSHPGDSHSFVETMPILAMPFVAPWGSLVAGVDRVRLVGPQIVIPTHDAALTDNGRTWMYRLAAMGLAPDGIKLVDVENFTTETFSV